GPTPDCAGVLSRWGTLLGLSETYLAGLSAEEKRRAVHTTLGTRSVLVVLDDVWHLEDVQALRIGGPNCAYLITTRFPKIAAHVDVHGPLLVEELGEEESMALLRVLAPPIVQREPDKTRQLVRAVGGLPLALTLVGNYLRRQTYNAPERRVLAALEL